MSEYPTRDHAPAEISSQCAEIERRVHELKSRLGGGKFGEPSQASMEMALQKARMAREAAAAGMFCDAYRNLALSTRSYSDAFAAYATPLIAQAADNSRTQSQRAKKRRRPQDVELIISEVSKAEGSTKVLWAKFEGHLEAARLGPIPFLGGKHKNVPAMVYETESGWRSMTIDTFRNRIRQARNRKITRIKGLGQNAH